MKCRLSVLLLVISLRSFSQSQTCPVNINYSFGDLTHWSAYTGNTGDGIVTTRVIQNYDSTNQAPSGTKGVKSISEYELSSVKGIQVITTSFNDAFGGFQTIPNINGYRYNYSILLGSTSITTGGNSRQSDGGYVRGVSYNISVPPGPSTEPYTMTYAYAMVLENGTHVSSQQPVVSVTLTTSAGVISCASPSYYLPTLGNVGTEGRGATLDSAAAKANGFKPSSRRSPNANRDPNTNTAEFLQDVWTKAWTEVTFDLSAYRGQKVSLNFEADNCVPGGHFAYAYLAVRNSCAGLMISGDSLVCNNTLLTYSVPGLAGATYNWNIPASWTLVSGDADTDIIQVKSSGAGGSLSVREKNGCADLSDTIQINTLSSPKGGTLSGSTSVCTGENSAILSLSDYSGTINNWVSSTDSITWTPIADPGTLYTASNLDTTTYYKAVVEKGTVCPPDSSTAAIIIVDQKSVGGILTPSETTLCAGQTAGEILSLGNNLGSVLNWQSSTDALNWSGLNPVNAASQLIVKNIVANTYYRSIDQNGACPSDTSTIASVIFDPVPFPQAEISPSDTTICFGATATLNATIGLGTSYAWNEHIPGNDQIGGTPYSFVTEVAPGLTADYVLSVLNNGCPNPLMDTFHINVLAPVLVSAGHDTSVVVGEPLQFHASSSDAGPDNFSWLPATGLNNSSIVDPIGTYTLSDNVIKYTVKAITPNGCSGEGAITVKVFKTKADIFVPNAFSPGTASNAIFRPIPVGISSLQYFRIYNRLGQLVYSTSAIGSGWDGNLNGNPQSIGAYVWTVKGTDYQGNIISKNGTMVLVR